MTVDILAAIDRATGCHFCEGTLEDSVSDLFCSEPCQQGWTARQVGTEPDVFYLYVGPRIRNFGITRHQLSALDSADRAFLREYGDRLRAGIADAMAAWAPLAAAMSEAWVAASESIRALVDAGMVEKPLPTEPRARALELRKHRNTGPTQQHRAPRAINPRRAR